MSPEEKEDSLPEYLTTPIAETRRTKVPHYGVTRMGYSVLRGAPTAIMVRLEGEKRWRRVMVWCFSNVGTTFVRVGPKCLIIPSHVLPVWP